MTDVAATKKAQPWCIFECADNTARLSWPKMAASLTSP